jgi:hypothetical protein
MAKKIIGICKEIKAKPISLLSSPVGLTFFKPAYKAWTGYIYLVAK